jgi:hypothetical protein
MVPVISANALLVRLGAWYVGRGAIAGDGVARAGLTLHRPALPQRVSLRLLYLRARLRGRKLSGRDM